MRTPASVREKENRKFRKVMLRRRKMFLLKKLFKEFWKEWGISKEELEMLLGAISVLIIIPVAMAIIGALF